MSGKLAPHDRELAAAVDRIFEDAARRNGRRAVRCGLGTVALGLAFWGWVAYVLWTSL